MIKKQLSTGIFVGKAVVGISIFQINFGLMKIKHVFIGILLTVILSISFYMAVNHIDRRKFENRKKLYEEHCGSCHGNDGNGLRRLIPPIANSDYVLKHREELACMIKFGMDDTISVNGVEYSQPMIGNIELDDDEIRDIMNYIIESWYPDSKLFTLGDVKQQLDQCLLTQ